MEVSLSWFLLYAIMMLVGYTIILRAGYKSSQKQVAAYSKSIDTVVSLVTDIQNLISKEELNQMTVDKLDNTLTLTDLVTMEPKDEDYDKVIELLTKLAKETYKQYKFLIAKSSNEKEEANFMQIVSHSSENPELHREIFAAAISSGIDIPELQKRFAEHVASGKVVDLGNRVTVIINDGTPSPPTGVSPINSGLEGGEIAFIISFVQNENVKDWVKHNLKDDNDE